jgi:hypothetical protein
MIPDFVNENLLYIVAAGIAAVLYIMWEIANAVRNRRSRRAGKPVAPRVKRRWRLFSFAKKEPPKPKDEDEFHADAAAQMTKRLEEQAREAHSRHEQRIADIERKIDKARRLVAESGIGSAAVALLATMWHWPVLARNRDWTRPAGLHELDYRPPSAAEAASAEEDSPQPKVLTWLWDGRPYRMEIDAGGATVEKDELRTGLVLYVEDDEVLELEVTRPQGGAEELWTVVDVAALTAGGWMSEFAAFAAKLTQADEEKHRQMQFERLGARAARIELGEYDPDLQEVEAEGKA